MIDLANIEKYKENNRIEAKKALGGLPHSIWETYSAFANTLGGIILLGVEEHKDKTLHPVDLPDPERLIKEFWSLVNNPKKASANILTEKDVYVQETQGRHIIVINIPRAQRVDRPVYLDGNPLNAYRRNGEGDYKCTKEDIYAMTRDASIQTQDMQVLEYMDLNSFDYDSLHRYRERMKNSRPNHAWEELDDAEFLYKIGAVGISGDGKMHPTAAGLLMFGYEREIVKEYPNYLLDYREQSDDNCTYRIVSSSGEWSGNVYDFYFRVCDRIIQNIDVPFDEASVHQALREALTNCLTNADYYGKQGLVVVKKKDLITLSNPGGFRIDVEAAKSGGVSDPRNGALIRMFNLVKLSECSGSGIPNIYNVWKRQGWAAPIISENFNPERITLSLPIKASNDSATEAKCDDEKSAAKSIIQKGAVVEYLTEKVTAKIPEIAELLGVKDEQAELLLDEMVSEETIVAEVSDDIRIYKLKS